MKRWTYFAALLAVLALAGCSGIMGPEQLDLDKDFQDVKIENNYAIKVPKYMQATKELHDEASLQYMQPTKEVYVIVIHEPLDSVLPVLDELEIFEEGRSLPGKMVDLQMVNMRINSSVLEEKAEKAVKVNGMDAMEIELVCKVPDIEENVAYLMTMVEGKRTVFTVMAWTLASRMDKYRGTFQQMVGTLKEL